MMIVKVNDSRARVERADDARQSVSPPQRHGIEQVGDEESDDQQEIHGVPYAVVQCCAKLHRRAHDGIAREPRETPWIERHERQCLLTGFRRAPQQECQETRDHQRSGFAAQAHRDAERGGDDEERVDEIDPRIETINWVVHARHPGGEVVCRRERLWEENQPQRRNRRDERADGCEPIEGRRELHGPALYRQQHQDAA